MADGSRTTELPLKGAATELLVNDAAGLGRMTVPALSNQLAAATGAVASEFQSLRNNQTSGRVVAASWSELAATNVALARQIAEVPDTDAGSHIDPVVGGPVPNAGTYQGQTVGSPSWKRIGATGLAAKADKTEVVAEAVARSVAITDMATSLYAFLLPFIARVGEGSLSGAFAALAMAAVRRVDIVGIGDSNQRFGGNGFDDGVAYAMSLRYPQYASHIDVVGANADGYLESGSQNTAGLLGPATGAPADFTPYILAGDGNNGPYQYYTGTNVSSANNGLRLDAGSPLDVNAALRAHYGYGTFATGGGSFSPRWRLDDSGFGALSSEVTIAVQTGAYGSAVATVDIPAAARNQAVRAQWSRPSGGTDTITQNFIAFWQRIERPDRLAGWSHNTLYGLGGQSLYDMAAWVIGQSNAALTNFFAVLRSFHTAVGQPPIIVVRITSGANDRNETSAPSLGPSPSSDPDSSEAYIDNLNAVVNRIEAIYALNGWALSGLYWLIAPTHRISDPDDAELIAYRSAVRTWATGRVRTSVIDYGVLMTAAEATANGWYDAGGAIHLTQAGYRALAAREIASGL